MPRSVRSERSETNTSDQGDHGTLLRRLPIFDDDDECGVLDRGHSGDVDDDGELQMGKSAVDDDVVKWWYLHGPADIIVVFYLAMTTWPYFTFPRAAPQWMAFHIGYFAVLVLAPVFVFRNRLVGEYIHWLIPVVLDYHMFLFFGVCYTELGQIIPLVDAKFRDYLIQEYEERLFRCQMSQELHKMFPFKLLGEYLCFCYIGYFLFIFLLLFVVGLRRSRETLHVVTCTMCFVFTINYFVFTYFPVEGPYWQLNRVDPGDIGYTTCKIVHHVLNGGSSHGTAFPSSHVSVAITLWMCALRYHRKLAIFYTFFIPGLCVATVYGGFHYGVDALWGLIFGLVFSTVGNTLALKLLPYTYVGNISNVRASAL